jgi:heterodisulfide reductase subunit A-like polyferredoxin
MHLFNRVLFIFVTYYLFTRFYSAVIMPQLNKKTIVIVGGGLAGLSAAINAHQMSTDDNTKIILVEKEKNIGYSNKELCSLNYTLICLL